MEINKFQDRVQEWMQGCFGSIISADTIERNFRFLEEALELVQSCGTTKEQAIDLVNYVFDRPIGEKTQEVGGVIVTLAALCSAHNLSLGVAATEEIQRIEQPHITEKIRLKQANKKIKNSPLP